MNYLSNYPWQEDHDPAESWEGPRGIQLFGKRDDDDLAFPVDFWDRHHGGNMWNYNKRSMGDSMRLGKRSLDDDDDSMRDDLYLRILRRKL